MTQEIPCRAQVEDPRVDISCHQARSSCDGERWGPCHDNYSSSCDSIVFGPSEMNPGEDNSDNVTRGVEGELLLDPDEKNVDFGYVWIANCGENTVSKMDVATGKEVARYPSVMDGIPGLLEVPIPYPAMHPYDDCANCPSRTAIDFNGDAYVANRAFGAQSSVTKFANAIEDCVDRNGDNEITTSVDVNDDGMIDVTDPQEFPGFADECVLWTSPVGGEDGVARALAVDAGSTPDLSDDGNVWVGLFNEQRAVQLSGIDGSVAMDVDLGEVHPYGAAMDGAGRAWFTGLSDGKLVQVDTFVGDVIRTVDVAAGTGCAGSYGIAVDVNGRIWLGGWDCNTAIRYDPATDEFGTIEFAGLGRGPTTRGIAPDMDGNVWVAHTEGWVTKFDGDTMDEIRPFAIEHHSPGEAVNNTIGVGIDRYGACWVVSRNDLYAHGTVTRILPDDSQEGWPGGLMPYTYSDFTGFGLFTVVRPTGWYNVIVSACEDNDPEPPDTTTDWELLDWQETEPPGTSVRVRFKVGDDLDTLDEQQWWGPYDVPPVDLAAEGVPNAQYMLIQILVGAADASQSPAFIGFDLSFDCGDQDPLG
jgi:streptogramin lyase